MDKKVTCSWCGFPIAELEKTRTDYLNGERFLYHYNKVYDCLKLKQEADKK